MAQVADAQYATVQLSWTDVSNIEERYEVERREDSQGLWIPLVGSLPANTESFTDDRVVLGVTYSYRVRTMNNSGPSAYSTIATITLERTYPRWLNLYFSELELDNPLLVDAESDPDGDGFYNYLEYGLGGHPRIWDTDPIFSLSQETEVSTGLNFLRLDFVRYENADDLVYFVEASSDLVTWEPIYEALSGNQPQGSGSITETGVSLREVSVIDYQSIDMGRRFARLKLWDGFANYPYASDFEFLFGPRLGMQDEWISLGDVQLQSAEVFDGAQAVELLPVADSLSVLEKRHQGVEGDDVWTQFALKPVLLDDSTGAPLLATDTSVAFYFNSAGRLRVYDGNVQNWVTAQSLSPINVNIWQEITVQQDYAAQTWSIWVGGNLVFSNLGFANMRTSYQGLRIQNGGPGSAFVDGVSVGTQSPL